MGEGAGRKEEACSKVEACSKACGKEDLDMQRMASLPAMHGQLHFSQVELQRCSVGRARAAASMAPRPQQLQRKYSDDGCGEVASALHCACAAAAYAPSPKLVRAHLKNPHNDCSNTPPPPHPFTLAPPLTRSRTPP